MLKAVFLTLATLTIAFILSWRLLQQKRLSNSQYDAAPRDRSYVRKASEDSLSAEAAFEISTPQQNQHADETTSRPLVPTMTNKGITCNAQQPNNPFHGVYIDRDALKQHEITQTYQPDYPVNTATAVLLNECYQQLQKKSYCVIDVKELKIKPFKTSETRQWNHLIHDDDYQNRKRFKVIEAKLNQKVFIHSDITIKSRWGFRTIRRVDTSLHQDTSTWSSLRVWISLKPSKRLVLRSHETGELTITQPNQAVIFYSHYVDKAKENRSVWHAGFLDKSAAEGRTKSEDNTEYNSIAYLFFFIFST